MILACCDPRRRDLVAASADWTGIDLLEVLDGAAPAGTPRQRTLLLRMLKPVAGLSAANVAIEGGERIRPIRVLWAHPAPAVPPAAAPGEDLAFLAGLPEAANVLVVRTDLAGDFSSYTLRLRRGETDDRPPPGCDPPLSRIAFSFRVECPSEFDCLPRQDCTPEPPPEPEIDYLARDYQGFRRAMLDRLALVVPGWQDRSPADAGVTLVELLAHVADQLSWRQDAIATEAYLATARRRVSVRRHARLVDYRLGEGCAARAFVQIRVDTAADDATTPILLRQGTALLTRRPGFRGRIASGTEAARAGTLPGETFLAMHDQRLFAAHDRIAFHDWGDAGCCLPAGAVRATLAGHLPGLAPGDVLVLEEVIGPRTGLPEDADPAKRHAVRLTAVLATGEDDGPLRDPILGADITEIAWHPEDALPFPLCVSSRSDAAHGGRPLTGVSVARGNIVLADHGVEIEGERLGPVPPPRLHRAPPAGDRCDPALPVPVPPRFAPRLATPGLAWRVPRDPAASARAALDPRAEAARPDITLAAEELGLATEWRPAAAGDLLASPPGARDFVPEVEEDGTVTLRFGDDRHGMRPQTGTAFVARYRVGGGAAGNLGAEALEHVLHDDARILGARNPLPARGGADPEPMESARRRAPHAYRTLARAVTGEDYAELALRHPRVRRAAATFRWTGSWRTATVTVDAAGGAEDPRLVGELRAALEPARMAGTDLAIGRPRLVPLELDLHVCIAPERFRADVRAALLDLLGNRTLPDGRRGLFHPEALGFGVPVRISAILAAAQSVPGVLSAEVTRLHRQGEPNRAALEAGELVLGRLEIARLDNDRNFPEHGVLRLDVGGGK